jgi:N-methylhydantoinase A
MSYVVAVDIGGTFTDLVAFDRESHKVIYTKSPTTYGEFVEGIFDCFDKAKISPRDVTLVNHGTTLVINALIQRSGGRTALITTEGFRDVIEIARGNRPDPFDLYYQRDEPLVPRELRFEVRERVASNGTVIEPLDIEQLRRLAIQLCDLKLDGIAISFMNSYANPAHEQAAASLLKQLCPDVFITASTELSREWYEYERTATAAANAYVGAGVNSYVRALDGDLRKKGFPGNIYMMGSNGGVLSVDRTCQQPIALVESGPIGGCIGAGVYAETLGFRNVIAFDMGGTTAKCTLVEDGRYSVESTYYVGGYIRGFPIKSPVINIVEVGSGGGSIAWRDSVGRLHVGPNSAGSTPGPACYGRGGKAPTVTDANLLLGRLNPRNFLGGELILDVEAAKQTMRSIANDLGYEGETGTIELAAGIVSIATSIMAGAIRRISVEHGRDPRDFILFSYGGGGPLHASALARELSIPTIVVPPEPGNFSAIGMLLANARIDDATTFTGDLDEYAISRLETAFADMESRADLALRREFGVEDTWCERFAEMRFKGQRHNIKVPIPIKADAVTIRAAFERDYKRRYGHADPKAACEFQTLHLSAFARLRPPGVGELPRPVGQMRSGERFVYFDPARGPIKSRVFDRYSLQPGFRSNGPAVIEEYGSTTVVWPGDSFEIGTMHELRISCDHEASS